MPGSLTNYAEDKLLDHILGTTSYTRPTVYLALYTSAPTESSSGTEVTGGSYVRKAVSFTASSSGASSNSSNVDFTGMPACTVVAVGVLDALTSGNLLFYATLSVSKAVLANDTFRISAGDLDVSLS